MDLPAQHGGGLLSGDLHRGAVPLRVLDGDGKGAGGLVAVVVHHRDADGVAAVGQLDARPQGVRAYDDAIAFHQAVVHIQGSGGHAGVVGVGLGAVAEERLDVQRPGGQGHVAGQGHGVSAAGLHSDGVNDRGGGIFRGAAIDKRQIVKIKRAAYILSGRCLSIGVKCCHVIRNRNLANFHGFPVDLCGIWYMLSNISSFALALQIPATKGC